MMCADVPDFGGITGQTFVVHNYILLLVRTIIEHRTHHIIHTKCVCT
jgi:hypothetical protein